MASIFLAAKMDEVPRKATDVINVFYRLNQIRKAETGPVTDWSAQVRTITTLMTTGLIRCLKRQSQTFWDMKQSLFSTEKDILKDSGFRTFVEHPHKFMLNYLRVLGLLQPYPELSQKAWNYINDRYVKHTPQVLSTNLNTVELKL